MTSRAARLARHRELDQARIVGIDDVLEPAHFADAEPFQLGVLVACGGRVAALPTRDDVDVMQRVAIELRLALADRCDEPEPGRCHPGLFLNLTDQRVIKALAVLDVPADRVPMVRPSLFRGRAQAEQDLVIWSHEQRADGSGGFVLHGGVSCMTNTDGSIVA